MRAGLVASSSRRSRELDHRDGGHERALPVLVRVDVALDEGRGGEARRFAFSQQLDEGGARLLAQVTARARIQVEVVHRSAILVRRRFEPAGRFWNAGRHRSRSSQGGAMS